MITKGIGTVAHGMQSLIDFEDITAHNLANVTTTGFKRTNVTFQDVMQAQVQAQGADKQYHNVGSLSNGARVDRTYIDFSQGALQQTDYKLDVAIQGQGFFKIRHQDVQDDAPYNESDYYYQRVGNFELTTDNYLINKEGDFVMDNENRRIRITRDLNARTPLEMNRTDIAKNLVIGENGQIELCDSDYIVSLQKIQICDFKDKTKVSGIGEGKYLPIYGQDAGVYTKEEGTFNLQQGMLEMSNANTIREMLNSINISRGYESMSNILKTQSDTLKEAISLGSISK